MVVQDALKPAQSAAQDAIQQLARLVSQQPDLEFPISRDRAQTWLINTYLDDVGSLRHSTQMAATPVMFSLCRGIHDSVSHHESFALLSNILRSTAVPLSSLFI